MKRTFIAIKIKLDTSLLQVLNQLKKNLANEKTHWVSDENLHVTLHFLGNTDTDQIEKIIALLETLTTQFAAFSFQLGGLHSFKKYNISSVLFFAIEEAKALSEFAAALKSALSKIGYNTNQPYKPHLTLGRLKKIQPLNNLDEVIGKYAETDFQTIHVHEIIFYESILTPEGPRYIALKQFPLL